MTSFLGAGTTCWVNACIAWMRDSRDCSDDLKKIKGIHDCVFFFASILFRIMG